MSDQEYVGTRQKAKEVYDVSASAPINISADTEHLRLRDELDTNGTVRIDDMANGEAALVGWNEEGDERFAFHTLLDADQARELGQALQQAAEVLEESDGDE